jgi:uncharacterized protein YpmB
MGKKWILLMMGIFVIAAWQTYYLYSQVQAEPHQEEKRAIETAKKSKDLKSITNVEHFFKNETYYVVEGKNEYGTDMIVWVGDGEMIYSDIANGGLSEREMIDYVKKNYNAEKIIDSRLGMEDEIPLWEVTFLDDENRYTYYYGYFETGKRYEIYRLRDSEQ